MAKYFDMRFTYTEDGWPVGLLEINWTGDFGGKVYCQDNEDTPDRFYIHPDSIHLLEPQENDLTKIIHADGETASYCKVYDLQDDRDWLSDVVQIIQRNGIPFMWPECEP